jgi:hypothetical protein
MTASQVLQTRWQMKIVRMEESSSWARVAGKLRRMLSSSSGMAKTCADAAVMFRGSAFVGFLLFLCCLSIVSSCCFLDFIYSYAVCSCMYAAIFVSTFSIGYIYHPLGSSLAASMSRSDFAPLASCSTMRPLSIKSYDPSNARYLHVICHPRTSSSMGNHDPSNGDPQNACPCTPSFFLPPTIQGPANARSSVQDGSRQSLSLSQPNHLELNLICLSASAPQSSSLSPLPRLATLKPLPPFKACGTSTGDELS